MDLSSSVDALRQAIRDVPDFPKPGIVFKDITPLLGDARLLRRTVDLMAVLCGEYMADKVASIESRGFIVGSLLAERLNCGFVPVRKPGKLPAETLNATYELEYGTDTVEVHKDAVRPGERVLVVDDVIATGGTARAAGELVERLGGEVVAYAFLLELDFLKGRERLGDKTILSLIHF